MNILNLESISKQYGEKTLFREVSLGLDEADRVGIIGVNGSGKSTLLKIIAGLEQPDSGRVTVRAGVRVGYLAQNPVFDESQTVLEQVYNRESAALDLLRRYAEATERLERQPDDAALLDQVASLGERISAIDAWDLERAAKTILSRLGIRDVNARVGELSGGQRKRVAMARVLIDRPDLLILDEPTNHIDPDTIAWLEGYLASSKGALLLITHDRYFLDKVCNKIIELERGSIYSYPGNYERFLVARAERAALAEKAELDHRNLARRELAWLRQGAQGRTTKQKARVERATAIVNAERRADQGKLELEISGRRMGKRVIEINHLGKRLAGRQLLSDFSYELLRDDRLGVIGPNGSGKSTLLNLIAGRLQPDQGEVIVGETIHLAYYDQTSSNLDESQRLIDYITDAAAVIKTPDGGSVTASQMLERFLFPQEQQWAPIGTLSGGERRRLYLLRTLMQNPNVLLLDEPSNDLDVQTLAILEEYLESFPGAVIAVSHDRAFLDHTVDHLLAFESDGRVRHYPGGYTEYRAARAEEEARAAQAAKAAQAAAAPKGSPAQERPRKLTFKEQRELAALEGKIAELEAEQARLTAAINVGGSDYQAIQRLSEELARTDGELEASFERWAELAELAAATA
ncbi:MAG TPA: ABC-F family ATP-binding cassette domain-containing protein [Herpetosiphonaceae bacterium]